MNIIKKHLEKYSLMSEQDLVKLLYQRHFGPGHILSSKEAAINYLTTESLAVTKTEEEKEDIGNNVIRVYLAKNTNIPALADEMIASAKLFNKQLGALNFAKDISKLKEFIVSEKLPFETAKIDKLYKLIVVNNYAPIHHSDIYNKNYYPHYRIIHRNIDIANES